MSEAKRLAGEKAIEYVEDGMVVGVGTGSTVAFFIDALARMKHRIEGAVSSSSQSTERLLSHGIEVLELNDTGPLTLQGVTTQAPAHCLVKGKMKERTGPVDGASYAIGFEMRLPVEWNGRFLYQANGGNDGVVAPALGANNMPDDNALSRGFAMLACTSPTTGRQTSVPRALLATHPMQT